MQIQTVEIRRIRVMGRREIPGRSMIYGTTQKFLEMFDLKDLKEILPVRFRTGSVRQIPASGSRNRLQGKESKRAGKAFLRAFRNARRRASKRQN